MALTKLELMVCGILILWMTGRITGSRAGQGKWKAGVGTSSGNAPVKVDHTGMAFIRPPWELNKDFFFSLMPLALKRRKEYNLEGLVHNFIRNVKGLPVEKGTPLKFNCEGEIPEKPKQEEADNRTQPDWNYNPYRLSELVDMELKIYHLLLLYYEDHSEDSPFFVLESYLKDVEDSSLRAVNLVEASNRKLKEGGEPEDAHLYVASHPFLIYRMIRRFALDLPAILTRIGTKDEELVEALEKTRSVVKLPDLEDLKSMQLSIHRLQLNNNLNTYHMANGLLGGVNTGVGLNALQCLELGVKYLANEHFDLAVQWLHHAYQTVKRSNHLSRYPEIEQYFRGTFFVAAKEHNRRFHDHLDIPSNFSDTLDIFDKPVEMPYNPKAYKRRVHQMKNEARARRTELVANYWPFQINFIRLCSGENLQTESEKARLKCLHYIPNKYWLLHPLKTEVLYDNPRVLQIYNFISEQLMKRVKLEAIPYLRKSNVFESEGTAGSERRLNVYKRTSVQVWLDDLMDRNSFFEPFTHKLELLTGLHVLHTNSSEAYQVAVYGPTHFFAPHVDTNEEFKAFLAQGPRLTTIMAYLNSVKAGGRTAFPVLGTFAEPVKGSIVMWDTMLRNGNTVDERTLHGGCPVTLGIKWIMNKWVGYNYNAFTFKCTKNPED